MTRVIMLAAVMTVMAIYASSSIIRQHTEADADDTVPIVETSVQTCSSDGWCRLPRTF